MSDAGRAPRVAIIDDDQELRAALGDLLDSMDVHNTLFASADDFLNGPETDDVDLVISDVHMPGTTGLQLAKLISGRVATILISAYPTPELERQALGAGVRKVLHKPFAPHELLDLLDAVLR